MRPSRVATETPEHDREPSGAERNRAVPEMTESSQAESDHEAGSSLRQRRISQGRHSLPRAMQ